MNTNENAKMPKDIPESKELDTDADKSGSDNQADATQTDTNKPWSGNKFEKPEKEVDPDTTNIDTDADATKIEEK
ncbi:MAG: hypothetical protein HYZ42_09135 [Bacteroidetes bacterium]|nr:hypothetical protein [Bacteroidota bacterium]